MNEDYVSYELAKKLKKCGFNGRGCRHFYYVTKDGKKVAFKEGGDGIIVQFHNEGRTQIPAATLWHAQKWLREKKKIDVLVYNCACGYTWEVSKAMNGTGLILYDEKGDDENSGCWTSYEAALSAGISASLELIKTGE